MNWYSFSSADTLSKRTGADIVDNVLTVSIEEFICKNNFQKSCVFYFAFQLISIKLQLSYWCCTAAKQLIMINHIQKFLFTQCVCTMQMYI